MSATRLQENFHIWTLKTEGSHNKNTVCTRHKKEFTYGKLKEEEHRSFVIIIMRTPVACTHREKRPCEQNRAEYVPLCETKTSFPNVLSCLQKTLGTENTNGKFSPFNYCIPCWHSLFFRKKSSPKNYPSLSVAYSMKCFYFSHGHSCAHVIRIQTELIVSVSHF